MKYFFPWWLAFGLWACFGAAETEPGGWELIWQDEFEGAALNPAKWEFEVNGRGGTVRSQPKPADSKPAEIAPPNLLFIGNMGYPPCADAVLYFCREILPSIRRQIGAADGWACRFE